jgi:hypothetical protein
MIEEMMANARNQELSLAAREQAHRQEWDTLTTIDRLEQKLEAARNRLHIRPAAASR